VRCLLAWLSACLSVLLFLSWCVSVFDLVTRACLCCGGWWVLGMSARGMESGEGWDGGREGWGGDIFGGYCCMLY
jgi:hypothetical protein